MSIMKVVAVILDYIVAVVTIISDYTTSSQWVNYGKMEKESNHDCSSQWVAGWMAEDKYTDPTTHQPTNNIIIIVLSLP